MQRVQRGIDGLERVGRLRVQGLQNRQTDVGVDEDLFLRSELESGWWLALTSGQRQHGSENEPQSTDRQELASIRPGGLKLAAPSRLP
jgi:hypothetical protein